MGYKEGDTRVAAINLDKGLKREDFAADATAFIRIFEQVHYSFAPLI